MELSMGLSVWIIIFSFVSCVCGVDFLDVNMQPHREKECYGTNMGFSFSGTHEYHYESLRRRYKGCTYVQGNLEVTNLDNGNVTYDLSFLSTIKVITGYVLLGLLNVETIPLTSLRLIRADNTIKLGKERYALVVALTSFEGIPTEENPTPGLKELQMPALREISQGKTLFYENSLLCHFDTIAWDVISSDVVEFKDKKSKQHCDECSPECEDDKGVRRCWGHGPHMCQKVTRVECDVTCHEEGLRCYQEGLLGCCHPECAVGCRGSMDTECEMCKHFRFGHKCVPTCPAGTYPIAQECIDF